MLDFRNWTLSLPNLRERAILEEEEEEVYLCNNNSNTHK